MPERSFATSTFISPPKATMFPSWTRTIVSGSSMELSASGRNGSSSDVGHEELVRSHLQDGFLVVQGRNPRARQDLDVSLRFQKLEQSGEILGLNSEPKYPSAHRACRRYGSAGQAGSQNARGQGAPGGINGDRLVSRGKVARRSELRIRPEHTGGEAR